MKLLNSYLGWLDNHIDIGYSLIRIFLGFALFVRGVILAADPETLTQLAGSNQFYWLTSYIVVIHTAGGLFLAIGFLSRIAALLQIPILVGAIFFLHLKVGLATVGQSLELSVIVLLLLVIYFLFGPSKLSIDNYIKQKNLKKY